MACWDWRHQAAASPNVCCHGHVREGSCSSAQYYNQSSVDILQYTLFSFYFSSNSRDKVFSAVVNLANGQPCGQRCSQRTSPLLSASYLEDRWPVTSARERGFYVARLTESALEIPVQKNAALLWVGGRKIQRMPGQSEQGCCWWIWLDSFRVCMWSVVMHFKALYVK